jgi:hypothetical protein
MGKRPRVGDAKRESKFATKEMIVRAAWTACPIEEQGRVSANHHAGRREVRSLRCRVIDSPWILPKTLTPSLRTNDCEGSSFQNFSVCIQGDFLRLARQQHVDAAAGVADDSDLAEPNHALAKVGEYRNQHGKALVDFALGNGHMQLHFAAVRRSELVFEVVPRHLSTVDPFAKKPVQAAVFPKIHQLCHMFLCNGLE